jgi:hypothetical protein
MGRWIKSRVEEVAEGCMNGKETWTSLCKSNEGLGATRGAFDVFSCTFRIQFFGNRVYVWI